MSQSRAKLFAQMDTTAVQAWGERNQRWANALQRLASQVQRDADAARKEVKRRAAISKKETPA